jgi:N-acetylmuramic acid 6-phosphate etherase
MEPKTTEDASPRYIDLDVWESDETVSALYETQLAAVAAVGPALGAIAAAVDAATPRLRNGGRLVYIGAGTSGRIAAQDGAELTPTFGWPRERVVIVMAGGEQALLRSVENAEDASDAGAARMQEISIEANDVVLGLAASGATPFTVSAVSTARERGALTIGIANNRGSKLLLISEHPILIETGVEPLAGSTRLKAGTAQKVVLNLFSTTAMVRLGKIYKGMMVEMQATNAKLRERRIEMVVTITSCDRRVAAQAIATADGDIKLAALIALGADNAAARALLEKHAGNLRSALADIPRSPD